MAVWNSTEAEQGAPLFARVDGRAAELDRVRQAIRATAAGRGGVVLLEGEPGAGKSLLLTEALAGYSGCLILTGTAVEAGRDLPLSALLDCFRTPEAAGLRSELTTLLGTTPSYAPGLHAERRAAGGAPAAGAPAAGPAAGGSAPEPAPGFPDDAPGAVQDAPDPSLVSAAAQRITERLLELADRTPLVLVLDDLQWADAASLLVWARLARTAPHHPLLLLGARRPFPRRTELHALADAADVITLEPLAPEEAVRLATALLGGPPAPSLRRELPLAGGNPGYIRQTALAEDTPELLRTVARGLDFLGPEALDTLRLATLLDKSFTATALAELTGRNAAALLPPLEEALAAGVLAERGERLEFRVPLARRALAAGLPAPIRHALTTAEQPRQTESDPLGLWEQGRYTEAETAAREALARSEDPLAEATAQYVLHLALVRRHRPVEALAALDGALEQERLRARALVDRARLLGQLGRPAEAREALRAARALAQQTSAAESVAAELDFWAGDWDAALTRAEDDLAALILGHRDQQERAGTRLAALNGSATSTFALLAKALRAERQGHPEAALAVLLPAVDEGRAQLLSEVVRLALLTSDSPSARRAVDAAVGTPAEVHCRGVFEQDPEALREALTEHGPGSRPLPLGQLHEDLAVAEAWRGELDAARVSLSRAVDIYARLGASWDVARAEARLRSLGIRRTKRGTGRPATGWEALTPTEIKVAQLVTEGRSNPEIAAELFLSPRTVQTHVSHILGKLGMRSRTEVAREAARHLPVGG
ncbi:AAA family ATPase [Streptomyces sp. GC420]|uniref:AAA family ATPase n=1 Tax=Streptomyces sp. GC420 TaxID=2697568 RepID=UPI0014152554|nr:AAA family ATPase [Streptomyces sp. GC420]NBM18041.1 AAA family ATPase [Streptomyces sp. GC420]